MRYTTTAIWLHWLSALAIAALFALGWYMVSLPEGSKPRSAMITLHKSLGLTTFLVILLRLGWRLRHPRPVPAGAGSVESHLAAGVHRLLYVVMIGVPLAGYVTSLFTRYATRVWGVPLPKWGWEDAALNSVFKEIHVGLGWMLLALTALHVAGALKHLLINRDDVVARMLPFLSGAKRQSAASGYGIPLADRSLGCVPQTAPTTIGDTGGEPR